MKWNIAFAFLICLLATNLHVNAAQIGEDGLHKQPWLAHTFKDIAEDITQAQDEDKRLLILIEQRGCIYCKRLHETVLSDSDVARYIQDNFMVVQFNMFGDEEVIDLDGDILTEKTAIRKWRLNFTPTMLFLTEFVPEISIAAHDAAVSIVPGAFGKKTVMHMLQWVVEKGYEKEEPFQTYHARKLKEGG